MDDLNGKVLNAVKKHQKLKYVKSEEEQRVFSQQWIYKQSMLTPYSHKIGNIDFLPTKQECELVEEDRANEISKKKFTGNETYKDQEIFQD